MEQSSVIDRIQTRIEDILQERGDEVALRAEQERVQIEIMQAEAMIIVAEAIERIAQVMADRRQHGFTQGEQRWVKVMPVDVGTISELKGVPFYVYGSFGICRFLMDIVADQISPEGGHMLAIDVSKIS